MNEPKKNYDLEERLIDFAITIFNISEQLPNTRVGNHLAGQIIRSGSSPALNYSEAKSAESKNDFIHKMKVCLKELRETFVCLRMIKKKDLIKDLNLVDDAINENNELISIFVTSVNTASSKKTS